MRCFVFLLLFCDQLFSQSEINSSGQYVSNNLIHIDYSISGISPVLITDNSSFLKFGVLQPNFNKNESETLNIYNFITANGDGKNDFFEIAGLDKFTGHNLTIFNKLGNIIFESTDYQNDWNGDSGTTDGTYFFELKLGNSSQKGVIYLTRSR